MQALPQKHIASYIGVTPEFLSKMKGRLLEKNKFLTHIKPISNLHYCCFIGSNCLIRQMNRLNFIKKVLLGTGVFLSAPALSNLIDNDIDEFKPLDVVGFLIICQ